MTQIDNLTGFANQVTTLLLPDGTTAAMELAFHGATNRWVMNLTYGARAINGIGLCTLPNVLRQWRNLIPFGIGCATPNMTDPFTVNDFALGRVSMFLLTAADVQAVENTLMGAP